jgi:hypothetical protein
MGARGGRERERLLLLLRGSVGFGDDGVVLCDRLLLVMV